MQMKFSPRRFVPAHRSEADGLVAFLSPQLSPAIVNEEMISLAEHAYLLDQAVKKAWENARDDRPAEIVALRQALKKAKARMQWMAHFMDENELPYAFRDCQEIGIFKSGGEMTPEELIKARDKEARCYRMDNLHFHDSDGVDVIDTFSAGWDACERLLQEELKGLVEALEYYAPGGIAFMHDHDGGESNGKIAATALSAHRKLNNKE